MSTNAQLELAFDYIQNTNKNIFLTGKAGTGKTTFLHRVKEECIKRMAVVAPTGIAAINAKGMTIHSLFQLPFGPYLPGLNQDLSRQRKFSGEKIRLIKSLDLLIIDEISMVRADVLDAIDDVLRRYRDYSKAFGGVQLLMIGDLHQLPPVIRNEEWDLLKEHYKTPYFFGSNTLRETNPIVIQLKHIYRQTDRVFIDLLNKVRDNKMDKEVLDTLNSRYIEGFEPTAENPYITLTSHNAAANKINQEKLGNLPEKVFSYKAKIEGDFPSHAYPTEEKLEFKKGAQVLFIKNDVSVEKRYYNGKIGQIVRISQEEIEVQCPGEDSTIIVSPVEWKNVKYNLNESTKEVSEDEVGTFTQYPLKLAWAITIHKSQGLTFERAIIDAQSAFAHGQVYVALSRCTSFEGIVLRSKIAYSSVKTDGVVKNFSENAEKNPPDEQHLQYSKQKYQQDLILDIFDFVEINKAVRNVKRNFLEHENILTTDALNEFNEWSVKAENEIFTIADKFAPQIRGYFRQTDLPRENEALLDRLNKAGTYFSEKIKHGFLPELRKIPILTDNKSIKKVITGNLERIEKGLFIKQACFEAIIKGFSTSALIKTKANADIDFQKAQTANRFNKTKVVAPKSNEHPELYIQLLEWREGKATEKGTELYQVLPSKAINELTQVLPTDSDTLLTVTGIGKVKASQYGEEIIKIITSYCLSKGISSNRLFDGVVEKKPKKKDTKKESLNLFKDGKTIEEIAAIRGFVKGTIEGHLSHFVKSGEVEVFQLLEEPKVKELETYFISHPEHTSAEAFKFFDSKYSYSELRIVRNYLEFKGEK